MSNQVNWTVKVTKHGSRYFGYSVENPQGGSFSSSAKSLLAATNQAKRSIPSGEYYQFIYNGKDTGVRQKAEEAFVIECQTE